MPRAQYSLASLFGLTLALGAYVAAVAALRNVLPPADSPWRVTVTAPAAWLVLFAFYALRDRFVTLAVHCAGFTVGLLAWPFVVLAMGTDFGSLWWLEADRFYIDGIAFSFLAGTLPSFPLYLVAAFMDAVQSLAWWSARRRSSLPTSRAASRVAPPVRR